MSKLLVAKNGGDLDSDADKELSFSSEYNSLIEFMSGQASTTVNHGLGYPPIIFCFDEVSAGEWEMIPVKFDDEDLFITGTDVYYMICANELDDAEGTGNNNIDGALQIARDGSDLDTIQDLRKMQFSTGKGALMKNEAKSGSTSFNYSTATIGGGSGSKTITHSLGYVPIVFCKFSSTGYVASGTLPYDSANITSFPREIFKVNYTITDTELKFTSEWSGDDFLPAPGTITVNIDYHILTNKIE